MVIYLNIKHLLFIHADIYIYKNINKYIRTNIQR